MRISKQFLYAILFLAVFGLIVWGVYSITLKPAPSCFDNIQNQDETGVDCGGSHCVPCDIKNLKPLVSLPAVLFTDGQVFSVSFDLTDPNANFGASSVTYDLNFYDASGNILKTLED